MKLVSVSYEQSRLNFFRDQLAAANRRLDWSIWKDDGICFACREQVWIPGKPHRQVGKEKSHPNCGCKMDLEG